MVGKHRFNGLDLAHALDLGAKTAYKAVARPVEGTILTVIREAAAAAVDRRRARQQRRERARRRRRGRREVGRQDARRCCRSCARRTSSTRAARACSGCSRAPSRLPGAGPAGSRRRPRLGEGGPRREAVSAPVDETEFGYETVYLVRARPGRPLDLAAIQAHLETIGESVLVAGDAAPGQGPRPQRSAGRRRRLRALAGCPVADHHREPGRPGPRRPGGEGRGLRRRGRRDRQVSSPRPSPRSPRPAPMPRTPSADPATRLPLGVVAVAPSDGLAAILDGHGRALPGVRRVPDRPRRPGCEPVHGRAARGGPGDPGG